MNILFICNEYPPATHGGIGTFTRIIAEGLHARGHIVIVAGYYGETDLPSSVSPRNGIIVYRLRHYQGPFADIRSRIRLYFLIKKLIKKHSIDLLESPDYLGVMAFWPKVRIPVIVRIHGSHSFFSSETNDQLNKRLFLYEQSTFNRATRIIGVSKYVSKKTNLIFANKPPIPVIYNSIDIDPTEPLHHSTRDRNKIVFSGSITYKKGVFSLFKAWPKVAALFPQARLHLFGRDIRDRNGESTQSLLLKTIDPRFHVNTIFYGHVDRQRIVREFKTASVAVLPSFTEAFALAPLEAMAQGCPTVYTKLASGPEVIDNGKNGILIDPNNPAEIADAIITLLTDRGLAEKIGAEGRKSVESRFSNHMIIPQNEQLYADCINAYRGKQRRKTSPVKKTGIL